MRAKRSTAGSATRCANWPRSRDHASPARARDPPGIRRMPSLPQRILADISGKIVSGEWPPGHRIPYEHELTAHYGCSRMTVNKALTQLARAGLIERRKRSGSFVARPRSQAAVLEIHDIRTEVEALGQPYRYERLARAIRAGGSPHDVALGFEAASRLLSVT